MVDVEALSRQEQASVFMTLMAAFTAVLARYSGQDDFILGVPIANRNHVASEDLIGDPVNTLPIRTDVSGDPTFRTHLSTGQKHAPGRLRASGHALRQAGPGTPAHPFLGAHEN
jgi:non-ribosomal peptide synthetase component F